MRRTLLLSLALAGCGTTSLSAKGRQVSVLDADPGAGCVSIGTFYGKADPFFGALKSDEQLLESARNEVLNEAARRGATHVRFTGAPERWPSGTFGAGLGLSVSGEAYKCGQPPSPMAAPSAEGCTKDTDCKGDRICESRICVEPIRGHAP